MTPVFAPAKPVWLCISRPQRLLGLIWRHPISSLTSMAAQLPCTVINTVRPLHDSSFVLKRHQKLAVSKAVSIGHLVSINSLIPCAFSLLANKIPARVNGSID